MEATEATTSSNSKQAITGFSVVTFALKKTKANEKVRLVLEASVDAIGAGGKDLGDVLKAFTEHATGETDVGLSVFMNK